MPAKGKRALVMEFTNEENESHREHETMNMFYEYESEACRVCAKLERERQMWEE